MTQTDLRCFLRVLHEFYAHGDLGHFPAPVLFMLPHLVSAEMFGYTEVNPQQYRAQAFGVETYSAAIRQTLETLGLLKP